MKPKKDNKTNIDELLLNVLGREFFEARKIPIRFVPVTPKNNNQEITDKALVNL
jgi:hypothetical protein